MGILSLQHSVMAQGFLCHCSLLPPVLPLIRLTWPWPGGAPELAAANNRLAHFIRLAWHPPSACLCQQQCYVWFFVCVSVFLLWQSLCSSFVFSLLFLVVSVRKLVSCSGSCFVFTNTVFIFRELFVCLLVLPLDLTCCRVFNKLTFADLTWFFSPLYFWSSVRVDSPSHILLIHNTVQFINRKCEKYACKSFF